MIKLKFLYFDAELSASVNGRSINLTDAFRTIPHATTVEFYCPWCVCDGDEAKAMAKQYLVRGCRAA